MGSQTRISWTDKTWNPWQGCHKVSAGCKNCYMYEAKERWGQTPSQVRRSAPETFNAPLRWSADKPLVFACSWSDWFIEAADPWRAEAWGIIKATPHLTYQILTKRPENILARLPHGWGRGWPNVWLGVSLENQATAERRLPFLSQIPAAVWFVSAEPLLGPLNLRFYRPDWLVIGAESGPHRREMKMEWPRSLIAECRAAGVACFVKQDSARWPGQQGRFTDAEWALKQVPKEGP